LRRFAAALAGVAGLAIAGLYAGWWRTTADGAIEIVLMLAQTALLRWKDEEGWRYWYGMGGAITYALEILRCVPPTLRWLWREARPSAIEVTVGIVVFFGFPVLATVL
jgi:hypothetical protein